MLHPPSEGSGGLLSEGSGVPRRDRRTSSTRQNGKRAASKSFVTLFGTKFDAALSSRYVVGAAGGNARKHPSRHKPPWQDTGHKPGSCAGSHHSLAPAQVSDRSSILLAAAMGYRLLQATAASSATAIVSAVALATLQVSAFAPVSAQAPAEVLVPEHSIASPPAQAPSFALEPVPFWLKLWSSWKRPLGLRRLHCR